MRSYILQTKANSFYKELVKTFETDIKMPGYVTGQFLHPHDREIIVIMQVLHNILHWHAFGNLYIKSLLGVVQVI